MDQELRPCTVFSSAFVSFSAPSDSSRCDLALAYRYFENVTSSPRGDADRSAQPTGTRGHWRGDLAVAPAGTSRGQKLEERHPFLKPDALEQSRVPQTSKAFPPDKNRNTAKSQALTSGQWRLESLKDVSQHHSSFILERSTVHNTGNEGLVKIKKRTATGWLLVQIPRQTLNHKRSKGQGSRSYTEMDGWLDG